MKKLLLLTIAILLSKTGLSQDKIKVLFLGNSYTYVNDLPGMIEEISENEGKTFIHESITPGGCTLFQHVESHNSLSKIRQGDWDYVVLQEQSQLPVIDHYRHNTLKPSYKALYDSIMLYNPNAKVVGYMTWGRRYGGQQCVNFGDGLYCSADFVDFNHMQDTLTAVYCENAHATNSYVAPVGEAWKAALSTNPEFVLHSSDDSHPSYDGTFLAACVFYAIFWNETPVGTYHNTQIDDTKANILQETADEVVFNNLEKWNLKHEYIGENKKENKFKIINNPFDSFITIKNIDNITYDIKIFNLNGTIINETNSNSDEILNINNNKGLLLIQLIDSKGNTNIQKIIKY